jgi:1,2-phenylacetyl-CoA epoxidase PaaB subunit
MNDLQTVLDSLEDKRLDYVEARSRVSSDAQACRDAGIPKIRFYRWTTEERNELNDIAQRLKRETVWRAFNVFTRNAEKASNKIIKLVDSRNDAVALAAAKDISDRIHGKALQKSEISGKDGTAISIEVFQNAVKKVYGDDAG